MIDNYAVGQQVKVFFNLRGREYKRKSDQSVDFFTNLDCWRMERAEGGSAGAGTDYSQIQPAGGGQAKDDFDDVPF